MEQNQVQLFALINSIKQFSLYFLKRWYILFFAGVIGGGLGILYASFQKPKFKSNLTFALEENGGGLNGALNLAAQFGISIGNGGKDIFAGDNIIPILSSRRIVEDVLVSVDTVNNKEITLAQHYLDLNKISKYYTNHKRLGTIRFPVGLPREKFTYHQDSVMYSLFKNIVTNQLKVEKPDRKFNLYSIEFISDNEKFSKIFVERLLSAAIKFYTELRTRRSRQTIDILEAQLARLKGNATGAISKRAGVQDANLNPVFTDQLATIQKITVDVSAYGGAYAEVFKNLELAKYQYLQDIPLLQIIDAPNFPMENLKKGRLITGIYFALGFGFLAFIALYIKKVTSFTHVVEKDKLPT